MSGGRTADARLERLLHVLPAARRDGGASLEALAAALDTTPERILEDLDEVTARAYYHPGGWPDDVQILVEAGHVRVLHAAGLDRPVRLSPQETLCLALALRGTAASARTRNQGQVAERLLERSETYLASAPWRDGGPDPFSTPERLPDPEGIRELLINATRERRPCALSYVKAGARDASTRVVHPYAVVHAEGAWYSVARCTVEDAVRVFRVDRILAADVADGTFDVPDDFRAETYLDGGRVYDGSATRAVRVRYSPRISRWVRERATWEPDAMEDHPDGSVIVRHQVSDPHWVVGHTLQYGAEAEILDPEDLRALVLEVVERLG